MEKEVVKSFTKDCIERVVRKFYEGKTVYTLEQYGSMDLGYDENWMKSEWLDFTVRYTIKSFLILMKVNYEGMKLVMKGKKL